MYIQQQLGSSVRPLIRPLTVTFLIYFRYLKQPLTLCFTKMKSGNLLVQLGTMKDKKYFQSFFQGTITLISRFPELGPRTKII